MELLLLAISYKYGGLCVAGIDYNTYEYVRIGHANGVDCGAINSSELCISGRQCQILDVIDVDVKKMPINGCQCENYDLIKINNYIKTINSSELDSIYKKMSHSKYVFFDSNYKINPANINKVSTSLELFYVDNLDIYLSYNSRGQQAPYANFDYNGNSYFNIKITDSNASNYPSPYQGQSAYIGVHKDSYIMVSLPYDDWSLENGFFKYVSGIVI